MAGRERSREGHFAAGDGLRALAAILVLLFHGYIATGLLLTSRGRPFDLGVLGDVLIRLNAGVYLFFVLSGYLVGGPFVRAWLRGSGCPRPLRYLGRRARRIVPALVVVVPGLVLWHGSSGSSTGDVLALLAFGQVWLAPEHTYVLQQGWTLDIEVMFYLALPLLALAAARVRVSHPGVRLGLLLGALALVFVLAVVWRRGPALGAEDAGVRHLGTFAWAFVPGLLLAAVEPSVRPRLRGAGGRVIASALGALGVGSIVVLAAFPELVERRVATTLLYTAFGGGLIGGALVWQWTTGVAPRGLDTRVARALGRWSYGIYLVQIGVGLEMVRHVPDGASAAPALAFVLAGMLTGSIVLAAGLWWLVEQPVLTRAWPRVGRPHVAVVEVPTGVPPGAVPAEPVAVAGAPVASPPA